LQMEQYVFCITITYSRSLACKLGELNHFLTHTIKIYTTGSKWYCGFMKRHSELSLRQPHAKKKSRAAGFSKVIVSVLFNLLERTVECKVNGIIIYVYSVDECFNIGGGTGKVTMEKCNIAYLVSLKCAGSNHYNSNCLLCQSCWLLCPCYGEYNAARTCADLKCAAPPGFFIPLREQLCQQRIWFYKT
jgi:hypothetical protein